MLHLLAAQSLPAQQQILDSLTNGEVFFPAALLIIGVLVVMFGFLAYRWIVVFNCVALGFYLGGLLGQRAQIATAAAVLGALLLGAISWPLMKYAVAVSGGLVGAIVGMAIWAYCEQPMAMLWAGALIGLIVLGMLSFILFKTSVILFTCVQGALMSVLGAAALFMRYTPWSSQAEDAFSHRPILMPLFVLSIAFLGMIWQHQKHGFLGNDGAPGGGGSSPKPATSADKK
ncbi:MAG TPA: hypothetical protein VHQ47_11995 [Phycisphaerae bacterium]|jgi:hypothetical protein|nr:hypothetical protein [Phycisphaerae bacterium]